MADRLGVETIDREGRLVVIKFRPQAKIDPVRLVKVVHAWPGAVAGAAGLVEAGSGGCGRRQPRSPAPQAPQAAKRLGAGRESRANRRKRQLVDRPGDRWRGDGRVSPRKRSCESREAGSAGRGRDVLPSRSAARRAGRSADRTSVKILDSKELHMLKRFARLVRRSALPRSCLSASLHAEIIEQVLVKVNGEIVTKTDFERLQVEFCGSVPSFRTSPPTVPSCRRRSPRSRRS